MHCLEAGRLSGAARFGDEGSNEPRSSSFDGLKPMCIQCEPGDSACLPLTVLRPGTYK